MAGVGFYMATPEISLSAATARTIIEVTAASNHRALIKKVSVWFKGTKVNNEPVTVEFIRISTTGTGTGGTAVKKDADASETLQTTFKHSLTVEPTGVTGLTIYAVHPQAGYAEILPIDDPIPVSGGDLWGIRVTADDAVNCVATIEGEE